MYLRLSASGAEEVRNVEHDLEVVEAGEDRVGPVLVVLGKGEDIGNGEEQGRERDGGTNRMRRYETHTQIQRGERGGEKETETETEAETDLDTEHEQEHTHTHRLRQGEREKEDGKRDAVEAADRKKRE